MNERRINRLQEQIKQHIAVVLQRDLGDPQLGIVTITRVVLDGEFTQCKVYWTVMGDDAQQRRSAAVLQRARGLCQRSMAKAITTRTVPHVEFLFDTGIEETMRLNEILDELKHERTVREKVEGEAAPGDQQPPAEGPPRTDA